MGGKNKSTPAPAPPMMPPPEDNSALIMQMMHMMGGMMQNMPQAPQLPARPEVKREPMPNWKERQDQLLEKSRADYTNKTARNKGRADTVLTSPLLDDDEANTTDKSLLSGGS